MSWNWENKVVEKTGVHYSRYIASWCHAFQGFLFGGVMASPFLEWLKANGASDEEAHEIWRMATEGKMELQTTSDARNIGRLKRFFKWG